MKLYYNLLLIYIFYINYYTINWKDKYYQASVKFYCF